MAQAQSNYHFRERIEFRSHSHRLVYAPGDPSYVMPDIREAQILSLSCNPIQVSTPKGQQRLFMTVIELRIPARASNGRVYAPKDIIGFRVYRPEQIGINSATSPETAAQICTSVAERTPPEEMAMYAREGNQQAGNPAQEIFDAVTGINLVQASPVKADTQWAQDVLSDVGPAPQQPTEEATE